MFGRHSNYWSNEEIKELIRTNEDKDAISFHCWGYN